MGFGKELALAKVNKGLIIAVMLRDVWFANTAYSCAAFNTNEELLHVASGDYITYQFCFSHWDSVGSVDLMVHCMALYQKQNEKNSLLRHLNEIWWRTLIYRNNWRLVARFKSRSTTTNKTPKHPRENFGFSNAERARNVKIESRNYTTLLSFIHRIVSYNSTTNHHPSIKTLTAMHSWRKTKYLAAELHFFFTTLILLAQHFRENDY
jgi:pterin-4a-carbinolamine dehydratase